MRSTPIVALGLMLAMLGSAAAADRAPSEAPARRWAGAWASLWSTPDQRGQAALQAGDPAAAARLFSDPRRKAYAEAKAGQYRAAAKELAPLDDAAAQYNRGNALARTGDLAAALRAYGAALAKDPADRDARHNRDLVAKALANQPPTAKPVPTSGQAGKQDGKGGQAPADKSGASGQPGNEAASAPGQGAAPSGAASSPGRSPGSGRASAQASAAPHGASQPEPGSAPGQAAPGTAASGPGRDDAAEARRELTSGRAAPAAAASGAARANPTPEAPAASAPPVTPPTEQQLAEDQWLRGIPDDPSGLLRRKFLIQHLLRQQERSR